MSVVAIPVKIDTADFQKGFHAAKSNEIRRYGLGDTVDEETIVGIIRNLTEIAQEGWLSEEFLRQDAGIIVGWLVRCCEASNS